MPTLLKSGSLEPDENSNRRLPRNVNRKNFACDQCDFTTTNPLALKKHMLNQHVLMFKCAQCKFRCPDKLDYHRHMNTHIATYYHCDECEYVGADAAAFMRHKSSHSSPHTVLNVKSEVGNGPVFMLLLFTM